MSNDRNGTGTKLYSHNPTSAMSVDYHYIIVKVMEETGVLPDEILDGTKRQGVRGYATFKCEKCKKSWSTYRSHIVIDLREQQVVRMYKQKCMKCLRENLPTFRKAEFEELVEKAIEQEEYYRDPRSTDKPSENVERQGLPGRPPHRQKLCEKCGYGKGKPCWLK